MDIVLSPIPGESSVSDITVLPSASTIRNMLCTSEFFLYLTLITSEAGLGLMNKEPTTLLSTSFLTDNDGAL